MVAPGWIFVSLALAMILLAGCAGPDEGSASQVLAEDLPLFGRWTPLACDQNAAQGLSGGASLGGPFSGTVDGMGDAISALVGSPATRTMADDGEVAWSYEGGSAEIEGSSLRLFWSAPWPSETLDEARPLLAAALSLFDASLEWDVEGQQFANADGSPVIHIEGLGESQDGARSVAVVLRMDHGTGLTLEPGLAAPSHIDPFDLRHEQAAQAYVDCLEAAGEDIPYSLASPDDPAPVLGTWTIPFGARYILEPGSEPEFPGCLSPPEKIYVDAVTGAIVKHVRPSCA